MMSDEEMEEGGNNFISEDIPEDDVIKILLSTDNHIGYNEKCEVRGQDSVTAFEEVLYHAKKHDVDMILLGKIAQYNIVLLCSITIVWAE